MGNHIVKLEKNGEEIGAGYIEFHDLDFEDPALEAIQVLTPHSLYRMEIQSSGMDLSDPFEEPENRRAGFKVLRGGKAEEKKKGGMKW
jgi:hypothetical protein